MVDNIVGIEGGKKAADTYEEFVINVTHIDGTERELSCSFFGTYIENPDFMVFTAGRPTNEGAYPRFLINMGTIKSIEVVEIREVEE